MACGANKPDPRWHTWCRQPNTEHTLSNDGVLQRLIEITPRADVMVEFVRRIDQLDVAVNNALSLFEKSDPFAQLRVDPQLKLRYKELLLHLLD